MTPDAIGAVYIAVWAATMVGVMYSLDDACCDISDIMLSALLGFFLGLVWPATLFGTITHIGIRAWRRVRRA